MADTKSVARRARKAAPPAKVGETAEALTEAKKGYARANARLQVARAVWALWDRTRLEDGVDQKWLSERLGKHKGHVSRLMNGPGNWTLDTVADLLEAMEGRLTLVEAKRYREIDLTSGIEPSLDALRHHSQFWCITDVHSEISFMDGDSIDEIDLTEPLEMLTVSAAPLEAIR